MPTFCPQSGFQASSFFFFSLVLERDEQRLLRLIRFIVLSCELIVEAFCERAVHAC